MYKRFWTGTYLNYIQTKAIQIYDMVSGKLVLKIMGKQSLRCSGSFLYHTYSAWQRWTQLWPQIFSKVPSICSLLDVPARCCSCLPWEQQHLPLLRLSSSANLCTLSIWISIIKQTKTADEEITEWWLCAKDMIIFYLPH